MFCLNIKNTENNYITYTTMFRSPSISGFQPPLKRWTVMYNNTVNVCTVLQSP